MASFLEGLTSTALGAAKGFQGSRALQRELENFKIAQLLEQRKMDLEERRAQSEREYNNLRMSQLRGEMSDRTKENEFLDTGVGGDIGSLLGELGLPKTMRGVRGGGNVLDRILEQQFMKRNPQFYINKGGRENAPVTYEDAMLKGLIDILNPAAPFEDMDQLQAGTNFRLGLLKNQLDHLFKRTPQGDTPPLSPEEVNQILQGR